MDYYDMNFTIYTPRFNTRGGVIALHNLCRLLNEAGHPSAIWPSDKKLQGSLRNSLGVFYRNTEQTQFGKYRHHLYSDLVNQPVASRRFLEKSVVVYPEVRTGNPLNAQRIVRWILRTPNECFLQKFSLKDGNIFYWREKFLHPELGKKNNRLLHTPYYPLKIKTPKNLPRKNKYCFIRHKNKETATVDLGEDAICLDGMTISEIATVLQDSEYFVTYDLETGYTRIAILCGAIPIVIPSKNMPKEVWRPIEKERLGISYGFDDEEVQWANQTRDLAIAEIISSCKEAKYQAEQFAQEVIKLYS